MNLDNLKSNQEMERVRVACAYLFSPEYARDSEFLSNLKLNMVKTAFRQKARRYHPDLNRKDSDEMLARRKERFVKIRQAYEYLSSHLQDDLRPATGKRDARRAGKTQIIAVGGAKGGVGKSVFAANLSVRLSANGFDTVAADMDLGGANLHLFLGKIKLPSTVNDYLMNKALQFKDIEVETGYGTRLIGGNSASLGAANISYARKMKLLRNLRKIDADYVVVDLGGDTSYNVLDFFLAADHRIVVTTCDPASYLDAYAFIKVALFRKLNRLFGPGSDCRGETDRLIRKMIFDATVPGPERPAKSVAALLQLVGKAHPAALKVVKDAIDGFTPHLVVNMSPDETKALEPVRRIQEVAGKNLSIDVSYLGSLLREESVEKSVKSLVPEVFSNPEGPLAGKIDEMAGALLGI